MDRPKISLMGVQSGEQYLITKLNEYSKYCDYLEALVKERQEDNKGDY